MSGYTHIADYLSADDVKERMQMTAGFIRLQKWLVIYNAIIDPRPVSEIARHTGLSESTVLRIISEYNSSGPESFERSNHFDGESLFGSHFETLSI
ncbi:MAG: helix-turn-helix domain-containing protein [Syntrophobacteraceae bacterium]|nr:helix-turn-helix domain-containing protein [Desulfobacteraceae bacterium]